MVALRILNVAIRSENGVSGCNLMSFVSYSTGRAGASFDCRINAPKVDKKPHSPSPRRFPLSSRRTSYYWPYSEDDRRSDVSRRRDEAYFVSASLVLLSHFPRHYFSGCRHRHVLLAPKLRWWCSTQKLPVTKGLR